MGAMGRSIAGLSDRESFCMSSIRVMLFKLPPPARRDASAQRPESAAAMPLTRSVVELEILPATRRLTLICDKSNFNLRRIERGQS